MPKSAAVQDAESSPATVSEADEPSPDASRAFATLLSRRVSTASAPAEGPPARPAHTRDADACDARPVFTAVYDGQSRVSSRMTGYDCRSPCAVRAAWGPGVCLAARTGGSNNTSTRTARPCTRKRERGRGVRPACLQALELEYGHVSVHLSGICSCCRACGDGEHDQRECADRHRATRARPRARCWRAVT